MFTAHDTYCWYCAEHLSYMQLVQDSGLASCVQTQHDHLYEKGLKTGSEALLLRPALRSYPHFLIAKQLVKHFPK